MIYQYANQASLRTSIPSSKTADAVYDDVSSMRGMPQSRVAAQDVLKVTTGMLSAPCSKPEVEAQAKAITICVVSESHCVCVEDTETTLSF